MFLPQTILTPDPEDALSVPLLDFSEALARLPGSSSFLPFFRDGPWAGFLHSREARITGSIGIAVTRSNRWVIRQDRRSGNPASIHHIYHSSGKWAETLSSPPQDLRPMPLRMFDPACPIRNFLYQLISEEYDRSGSRPSEAPPCDTRLLHVAETFLRDSAKDPEQRLRSSAEDPALRRIQRKISILECDPVLNWKERQARIKVLREERNLIHRTKRRVHRARPDLSRIHLLLADLQTTVACFRLRPWSNFWGWVERLVLDPIRWFFGIVRGNMGYSIALAIYSPFTFFFITQPMNPHAMWAVGKVRAGFLAATETMDRWMSHAPAPTAEPPSEPAPLAASAKNPTGFPLSTDDPEAAGQTWEERMSRFKAMEIAYEEHLEIAPRLGRLEHMESQLNWPMTAGSAWQETERHLRLISFLRANPADYDRDFIAWVGKEEELVRHVQLYLWDRLGRFILDHPWTLMDQSREQVRQDAYSGRAFTLFREMTRQIQQQWPGIPVPEKTPEILALAERFEAKKAEGTGALERLQRNSPLFAPGPGPAPETVRDSLRRQWEILYLLENRAQEAALSGLQLYVWSVRNAIHLLQSIYSAKREDLSRLALALKHGATPVRLPLDPEFRNVEAQYEELLQLLVLEFTTIQRELSSHLGKDREAAQRMRLIRDLRSSLEERDRILRKKGLL